MIVFVASFLSSLPVALGLNGKSEAHRYGAPALCLDLSHDTFDLGAADRLDLHAALVPDLIKSSWFMPFVAAAISFTYRVFFAF